MLIRPYGLICHSAYAGHCIVTGSNDCIMPKLYEQLGRATGSEVMEGHGAFCNSFTKPSGREVTSLNSTLSDPCLSSLFPVK